MLVALALLVGGAEYFTNAVEWLGRRLNLSDSATGSFLAAVGTAMPETLVPIVAIFFSEGAAADAVGVGGILGAPFMISTLAMMVIAVSLFVFRKRRQTTHLQFNSETAATDLRFFLIAYGLAFLAALVPPSLHVEQLPGQELSLTPVRWLIGVSLIPLYGIYMARLLKMPGGESEEELNPLHVIGHIPERYIPFENWSANPGLKSIIFQLVLAFALIIGGAHLFVHQIQELAHTVGLAPVVLSLLITPIATELPEKLNSVIWISRKKDTLAFGNMSGALVFQSAFPVTVGILATPWTLSLAPGNPEEFLPALSCVLALVSGSLLLFFVRRHDTLHLPHLVASGSLYFVFLCAVVLSFITGTSTPTPAVH
jgi:cation:H+ antiporter